MSFGTEAAPLDDIEYPSSDGQPMAETGAHVLAIVMALQVLRNWFASREDVAVAANIFLYYERGNLGACVSPDVWVAIGAPRDPVRRFYKVWQEKMPPSFVLEVASRSSWRDDIGAKKDLYARMGVRDYFVFDPEGAYLDRALLGFRLVEAEYEPIAPLPDGSLESSALGLKLEADGIFIRFVDIATNMPVMQPDEIKKTLGLTETRLEETETRLEETETRLEETETRLNSAETRVRGAEAEIARLRAELAGKKDG